MRGVSLRLSVISAAGAGALAASLLLAGPAGVLAKSGGGTLSCAGGSIAGGTYSSATVTGFCTVDSGPVTVTGNLTVASGGELIAAFGGSNLVVDRNLSVAPGGILVLGCEPNTGVTCLDDATATATGWVGRNLTATGALAVIVHATRIAGNLSQSGGGGGVNCDPQAALFGAPFYATYEDVSIGGNASISGWHSCWLGFFRATVGRNVNFTNNVTFDPDGNEVATNTIGRNLNCSGNSPAPQIGDSGGAPNTVGRKATGQCVGLTN